MKKLVAVLIALCLVLTASAAMAESYNSVTIGMDTPVPAWDPMMVQQKTIICLNTNIYGTLVSIDPTGAVQLDLAESIECSDDGLTYTITLKDSKWSNGEQLTTDDFIFAWQRCVDITAGSYYGYMMAYANIVNANAIQAGEADPSTLGVEAIDDKTLVVTLEAPCAYFEELLSLAAFSPVNRAFVEAEGENFALDQDHIIAAGPYMLTAWDPASNAITITKNANYWDAENVNIDEINFQVIANNQAGVMSFERGEIDYVEVTGDLVQRYAASPNLVKEVDAMNWIIYFNNNVVSNAKLREAISCSLDREALAKAILQDGSEPLYTNAIRGMFVGPDGSDFVDSCEIYCGHDEERAKQLWAEAQEEGCQTELNMIYDADSDAYRIVAQYVAAQAEKVLEGLKINLVCLPKSSRVEKAYTNDYDLMLFRWGLDYADPTALLTLYESTGIYNWCYWYNDEFDQLIKDAQITYATDPEARWDSLVKAEGILDASFVSTPIIEASLCSLQSDRLQNMRNLGWGSYTFWKYVSVAE